MADFSQTRRQLILTLAAGLALLLPLGKFLRPRVVRKKALLSVAREDIPQNGALVYRESRVVLIRNADSIYALSLACTHLGCTLAVTPDELICPCHGSAFDRQGRVIRGPATRNLARHAVEERESRLFIMI